MIINLKMLISAAHKHQFPKPICTRAFTKFCPQGASSFGIRTPSICLQKIQLSSSTTTYCLLPPRSRCIATVEFSISEIYLWLWCLPMNSAAIAPVIHCPGVRGTVRPSLGGDTRRLKGPFATSCGIVRGCFSTARPSCLSVHR